jgi:hypothetical protein
MRRTKRSFDAYLLLFWFAAGRLLSYLHPTDCQQDGADQVRTWAAPDCFGTTDANCSNKPMASEQHAILRGILSYLSEHPNAQDTVEGIAEWWLLRQRIRDSVTATEQALNELVERDLVIRDEGADGRLTYRLNLERNEAVCELLARDNQDLGSDRSPGRSELD